jgi:hypothetical protein
VRRAALLLALLAALAACGRMGAPVRRAPQPAPATAAPAAEAPGEDSEEETP